MTEGHAYIFLMDPSQLQKEKECWCLEKIVIVSNKAKSENIHLRQVVFSKDLNIGSNAILLRHRDLWSQSI